MPRITKQALNALKKRGMIKDTGEGQKRAKNMVSATIKGIGGKTPGQENKDWIYQTLKTWCEERGYLLIREHTFSEGRAWRLDWAVFRFNGKEFEKVCGVEYEGIYSAKSRHTTLSGYSEDADKYRAAALEGWKVLRYTAKNVKQLENDLTKIESI